MSGPKSYSLEVFDKHLKNLFSLQSDLNLLWDYAKSCIVKDDERSIEITNARFIQKNAAAYNEVSDPFNFEFGDALNQEQFDDFYNHIHTWIEKQSQLKTKITQQIAHFDEIEKAYQHYLELEKLAEKFAEDYHFLKQQLLDYLEKSGLDKQELNSLIDRARKLNFSYELPPFTEKLIRGIDIEKDKLIAHFKNAKQKLGDLVALKGETPSEKVVRKDSRQTLEDEPKSKSQKQIDEIEDLLQQLGKGEDLDHFEGRLQKLKANTNMSDSYYFIELHEDLKQHFRSQQLRKELTEISKKIHTKSLEQVLKADVDQLKTTIRQMEKKSNLKQVDLTMIQKNYQALDKKNSGLLREKMIAQQEQKFIKARIIAAMQELNYEVAEDTQVLDLEKSDSFLLQIPDQENFLNIRFDESGHMLYNFLIPENRNALSFDEKTVKMAEMEDSCNAFKMMLSKLEKQGLDIQLKNEIKISEKALTTLPAKFTSEQSRKKTPKRSTGKASPPSTKLKK